MSAIKPDTKTSMVVQDVGGGEQHECYAPRTAGLPVAGGRLPGVSSYAAAGGTARTIAGEGREGAGCEL
eukprot:scaffold1581_cov342-Prasinococcus_capsulatus_cf.AAC.5